MHAFLQFRIVFRNIHLLIPADLFNLHTNLVAYPKASPVAVLGSAFAEPQHSYYVHMPTWLNTHQNKPASSLILDTHPVFSCDPIRKSYIAETCLVVQLKTV
jgi:hypothetical protein